MFFVNGTDIGKVFGVELISSSEMDNALQRWDNISIGKPPWRNDGDEIETININGARLRELSEKRRSVPALMTLTEYSRIKTFTTPINCAAVMLAGKLQFRNTLRMHH